MFRFDGLLRSPCSTKSSFNKVIYIELSRNIELGLAGGNAARVSIMFWEDLEDIENNLKFSESRLKTPIY